MSPRIMLTTLTLITVVMTACSTTIPEGEGGPEPSAPFTVEEAGFVAKGELFSIYGEEADPVIVTVDATTVEVEGQPGWQLDTLVHVVIDGEIEERRWRFWVALDPDEFPEVVRATELSGETDE